MSLVETGFDATVFSKNRERLLEHEVGRLFFDAVVRQARVSGLMSDDHFTVDGTLIEACASLKSFRPKAESLGEGGKGDEGGNPTVDFRGEKRSNQTHVSTTDPESRLFRKGHGREAKLCYGAHALMENRHGLLVDMMVTPAGTAVEWGAAEAMLIRQARKRRKPKTLGGDKGYDTFGFVAMLRRRGIIPHIAANVTRRGGTAMDAPTLQQEEYQISQRKRKRIEEIFGWLKTIGGFRRTRFKGRARTQLAAWIAGTAYNLLRIAKLKPDLVGT